MPFLPSRLSKQRGFLAADIGPAPWWTTMSKSQPDPAALAPRAPRPGPRRWPPAAPRARGCTRRDIDERGMRPHGEARDQAALDQAVRFVAQDLPVLAGARLRLVRIDHQIGRAAVGFLGHEGPFQPGRKARPAPAAQPACLDLFHDGVAPARQDAGGAVPGAARPRPGQRPVADAIEIGEDAVASASMAFPCHDIRAARRAARCHDARRPGPDQS
jgi:hypothetical protein